jgi:hypothetical protein
MRQVEIQRLQNALRVMMTLVTGPNNTMDNDTFIRFALMVRGTTINDADFVNEVWRTLTEQQKRLIDRMAHKLIAGIHTLSDVDRETMR